MEANVRRFFLCTMLSKVYQVDQSPETIDSRDYFEDQYI